MITEMICKSDMNIALILASTSEKGIISKLGKSLRNS